MDVQRPVVVTGAAGFVGYHVAQALLAAGHEVVGVDVLNDYYPVVVKERRVAQLAQHAAFRFERLDLADPAAVDGLFAAVQPEVVCHLAAQAGVRYSLTHPRAYLTSNLDATLNMLEGCRHHGARRLVYASSSSVYGANTKLPLSEVDRVDEPISLYAVTKRSNELMAQCYTHLYQFQTVGLRLFNVYGTWGRPDAALWIFTERISRGEPIKVFNRGAMRRDFTHVSDIVAGIVGSLFAETVADAEILNLGNHRCEELSHLIDLVEQAVGRPAERILMDLQPGDMQHTEADIDRAQAKLGFSPATPLDVGVPEFVAWYRTQPELAAAVKAWRDAGGQP